MDSSHLNPGQHYGKSGRERMMEALDEWNTQQIAQKILPIVRECCGNVCSAVIPQETPGVIAVTYPRNYESSYIRPRVLLEIGPKAAWNPHAEHTVRPYMAEVYPHLFHGAETSVVATTAERAFWEKITILHSQAPGAFGAYLRITILAPLKTLFLDSGQTMVRILSDIFPMFSPQNPPIFPFIDFFLLNFFFSRFSSW